MATINLNPNKRKQYDLDSLLAPDVSATEDKDISSTKDEDKDISSTNSDTNSATDIRPAVCRDVVSATEDKDISATDSRVPNSMTSVSATEDKDISATDSRSKYQNEWKRSHKDTVRIDVPKGYKELLKSEADKRGVSLTKLVVNALAEYLQNHPV